MNLQAGASKRCLWRNFGRFILPNASNNLIRHDAMRAARYDLVARLQRSAGQDTRPFVVEYFEVPLLDSPNAWQAPVADHRKTGPQSAIAANQRRGRQPVPGLDNLLDDLQPGDLPGPDAASRVVIQAQYHAPRPGSRIEFW
jgi:hypothetical protein